MQYEGVWLHEHQRQNVSACDGDRKSQCGKSLINRLTHQEKTVWVSHNNFILLIYTTYLKTVYSTGTHCFRLFFFCFKFQMNKWITELMHPVSWQILSYATQTNSVFIPCTNNMHWAATEPLYSTISVSLKWDFLFFATWLISRPQKSQPLGFPIALLSPDFVTWGN